MSEERYLTFALGKGRLAKKTLELFEMRICYTISASTTYLR